MNRNDLRKLAEEARKIYREGLEEELHADVHVINGSLEIGEHITEKLYEIILLKCELNTIKAKIEKYILDECLGYERYTYPFPDIYFENDEVKVQFAKSDTKEIFNVERFREDYPELYQQYVEHDTSNPEVTVLRKRPVVGDIKKKSK